MLQDDLQQRYFEWLYHLVCGDEEYNRLSYRKLLSFLHSVEFTWSIEMDEIVHKMELILDISLVLCAVIHQVLLKNI